MRVEGNLGSKHYFKRLCKVTAGKILWVEERVCLRDYYKSSGRDVESPNVPRSSKSGKEGGDGLAVKWIWE